MIDYEQGLTEYVVIDGIGQKIAGGFLSIEDAIAEAKRCAEPFAEVEARRLSRRSVWRWDDEETSSPETNESERPSPVSDERERMARILAKAMYGYDWDELDEGNHEWYRDKSKRVLDLIASNGAEQVAG